MRKYLKHSDSDDRYELSPLTYDEFVSTNLWSGASDMAFDRWLRHNNLHEIDSFNEETISDSVIMIEFTNRDYWFNSSGDGDTWIIPPSPVIGTEPIGGGLSGKVKQAVNVILKRKYGEDCKTV